MNPPPQTEVVSPGFFIPVIAIDGPSASGKGTVAQSVAGRLGFHYLDSGALYRLSALACVRRGVDLADEVAVAKQAAQLDMRFQGDQIFLFDQDVGDQIRTEQCGVDASRVAAYPALRAALEKKQREFKRLPGLVADGRDMGSVIFPDATLKIFLTATAEARAERRTKQLKEKGMYAKMHDVIEELQRRDLRDSSRSVAPLKHYPDAKLLDTTQLSIEQAVNQILDWYREISPVRAP
ncbi:MAG: (d)CMP kinase [Betaproteobacteria bacterium]|nr:(d)CMP kinase [Betaproteobacteria bacterium]